MGNPGSASRYRGRRATVLGLLGAAVVAAGVFWYVVIPYPVGLTAGDPGVTAVMEQRIREARAAGGELEIRHEWIPLAEVSPALLRAIVVAEDYRFREHRGVDWVSLAEEVRWTGDESFSWWSASDVRALTRALSYAWSHRAELRGRSTITQQVAKNIYFGIDRSFSRKAMEFVVAGRLERRLGKDRILELYVNIAEWGPGIFGAEAAARTYFGRSARDLGLVDAAALAATLPQPLTSNPARDPGRMRWRQSLILDRLDPSRGLPPVPGPLPDIEIDLVDVDLGATSREPPSAAPPPVPELDTASADSGASR
jgi:monofunctional biosynthetic peptidoglycan transglycosylase